MRFRDRAEAGRLLADRLGAIADESPIVLALPRGGVPVAAEIARALGAPLDVLVVRKIGHPLQPELGVGALGEGGTVVLNQELIRQLGVRPGALEEVIEREEAEVARRIAAYREGRAAVPVEGRTVVVVDDGLATGFTARAAIDVLRHQGAGRVVLAVPVAPADTVEELGTVADEVVCVAMPSQFRAIGEWYRDFRQVSDSEVRSLLAAM